MESWGSDCEQAGAHKARSRGQVGLSRHVSEYSKGTRVVSFKTLAEGLGIESSGPLPGVTGKV